VRADFMRAYVIVVLFRCCARTVDVCLLRFLFYCEHVSHACVKRRHTALVAACSGECTLYYAARKLALESSGHSLLCLFVITHLLHPYITRS
jgi:hypothetical protein